MAAESVILAFTIASSLISMASAIAGTATFYTPPYVPSSCYGYQDNGIMILAANSGLFNNGASCGRTCTVQCTGPTNGTPNPCRDGQVTVRIVDLCPGCGADQVDLSQEVFAMIANPDAGKVQIDYNCS